MDMSIILAVAKVQESFEVTVGIFFDHGFLLGIDADFLYASLGGVLVRLILVSSELVYWL